MADNTISEELRRKPFISTMDTLDRKENQRVKSRLVAIVSTPPWTAAGTDPPRALIPACELPHVIAAGEQVAALQALGGVGPHMGVSFQELLACGPRPPSSFAKPGEFE